MTQPLWASVSLFVRGIELVISKVGVLNLNTVVHSHPHLHRSTRLFPVSVSLFLLKRESFKQCSVPHWVVSTWPEAFESEQNNSVQMCGNHWFTPWKSSGLWCTSNQPREETSPGSNKREGSLAFICYKPKNFIVKVKQTTNLALRQICGSSDQALHIILNWSADLRRTT